MRYFCNSDNSGKALTSNIEYVLEVDFFINVQAFAIYFDS